MRTLELNKTKLWYVRVVSSEEQVDSDGNYTGDIVDVYSSPTEMRLHLYPSNGEIVQQVFGINEKYDKIALSNDVVLTKGDLLFTSLPTKNYDTTYDYSVKSIAQSLNTYQYGLVGRIK